MKTSYSLYADWQTQRERGKNANKKKYSFFILFHHNKLYYTYCMQVFDDKNL